MSHSPAPSRRRFFLDTEFIDIGTAIVPISVGVVTEEGRQFYVEIESAWRNHADEWTWAHVAAQLGNAPVLAPAQLREALIDFVGAEPAEFWAYFAAYDWVVVCQLMGGMLKLPKTWSPWVRDLVWLDPSRERIRSLKIHNPKPHHALYDAIELRDRYLGLQALGMAA